MNHIFSRKFSYALFAPLIFFAQVSGMQQNTTAQKAQEIVTFMDEHKGKIALGLGALFGAGLVYRYYTRPKNHEYLEEKTYEFDVPKQEYNRSMLIETGNGNITLEGQPLYACQGESEKIKILVSKKAKSSGDLKRIIPKISQDGTRIETTMPLVNTACNYRVLLPFLYGGRFILTTGNGDIAATNLYGNIMSRSHVAGSQSFKQIRGAIEATVESGNVDLADIENDVTVDINGTGNINTNNINSRGGESKLKTVQGNIIALNNIRTAHVWACDGTVTVDKDHFSAYGNIKAKGTVTIAAKELEASRMSAEFPRGELRSDFTIDDAKYEGRALVNGKIGTYGSQFRLTSENGDIVLRKKN